MARPTACFALSALLMLAIGIGCGTAQLELNPDTNCLQLVSDVVAEANSFIATLKPMRIISKDNPSLSMAADGTGGVVLAKTSCADKNQVWFQHNLVDGDIEFALVNLDGTGMPQAMRLARDGTDPVRLEPYKPCFSVPRSMLWSRDPPVDGNDGYYKIRSYRTTSLILDGLGGNVVTGTVIGAFPESHAADHVLWKIKDFSSTTTG